MPEKSILEELQASFSQNGKADWINIASTEVNAPDPLKKLLWEAHGQTFLPYYDQSDVQSLKNFQLQPDSGSYLGQRTWYNLPAVIVNDEKSANEASHNNVMQGADGILLDIRKKNPEISALLEKIEWPYCNVSFVSTGETSLPEEIIRYCNTKSYSKEKIEGSIFWKGAPVYTEAFKKFGEFKRFHPAGICVEKENPSEEIANALLHGVTTINNFIDKGITIENAIQTISFSLPAGEELLLTIAKFKTLRMLWYQVAKAYKDSQYAYGDLHIHARSEFWLNENYQPHGNMLKGTTSSIAAICGGCNSLSVHGEDENNSMMQRMARNTSVILREESHLNKVADPLAGSYVIEAMIQDLAQDSWQRFQSSLRR